MPAKDVLEARIACAYTLRAFDENSRRMKITILDGRAAGERSLIVQSLLHYGGEPWGYSPYSDNSWLPRV